VLYLVPRSKTDELLPLTVEPKPTEVVRVLVGRHDFLTPEQESMADRQVARARAARAELEAAERELNGIGRFSAQAQQMAAKRLETGSARR
jgi:regulator of protease activity HflC (stomatin/prohibitin superfamily)